MKSLPQLQILPHCTQFAIWRHYCYNYKHCTYRNCMSLIMPLTCFLPSFVILRSAMLWLRATLSSSMVCMCVTLHEMCHSCMASWLPVLTSLRTPSSQVTSSFSASFASSLCSEHHLHTRTENVHRLYICCVHMITSTYTTNGGWRLLRIVNIDALYISKI